MSRGVLLVTSGGRQMGLPLQGILEVGDVSAVDQVPGAAPAVRGMMRARGRLVPLAHLGALVSGKGCPEPAAERSAVLATISDRWLALEVEQVDAAPDDEVLPPPEGSPLAALAVGVVRRDQRWIPVLNLEALAERLQGEGGIG